MTEEITLTVSDEDTALEVAYGILGRVQDLAVEYGEEAFQ